MKTNNDFYKNTQKLLTLALPLIGSHLAQFSISLTDTAMLGWYDVRVLAGQVLGATLLFVVLMFGSGFAWAVMPMVATADSSGNTQMIRRVTRMGLWVSTVFALIAMMIFIWTKPILIALGQEPVLASIANQYIQIAGWALLPSLLVMVMKSYLAALELTRAVFWVTLFTALINALLNYLLIFGKFGCPELGIAGAGIATLLSNIAACIAVIVYIQRVKPEHDLFRRFWRIDGSALRDVVRLGWPISITTLSEVGLFAAATFMMGWLGEIPLAAHGIALQITSAVFMIHVGLSNAVTVRAGQAYGRKDNLALRTGAMNATVIALSIAVITATVFVLFPEILIGVFLDPDDPDRALVLQSGRVLLGAAALFQLVDASQILALSLLRGIHDTRVPMIIAAIAYWVVGVPVAYFLGFGLDWGGVGIWLGLAAGLALAAVLLMARFWGWSVRTVGLD